MCGIITTMKETLAILAAILAIVGNISYLKDVLTEKIQSSLYLVYID